MDNRIIRIALKPDARILPLHPEIERIVQEQVGKQRTDHTALRGAFGPLLPGAVRALDGGAKPPPNVQADPGQVRVTCATARSTRSCGMESKKALMSRSITQSNSQQRFRATAAASSAERPGR